MKERNKAVPAVYLIVYDRDKILLGKRQNTGYKDGCYNLPSGHIEAGELPTEAMIREAKEEIDLNLSVENLKLAHVSYRPKHDETGDRVDFFFQIPRGGIKITNTEPDKCSELVWVEWFNLPENMPSHVRKIIQLIAEKKSRFSEFGIDFLKKHDEYKLDK